MEDSQLGFDFLKAGDAEGLRQLLEENPASSEAKDASEVSLLMHCIYRGRLDLAELVASKRRALDIFEAASLGRTDRLNELISGASAANSYPVNSNSANSYSKDGFTALHFACFFGQPKAAKLLIDRGAAVDAVAPILQKSCLSTRPHLPATLKLRDYCWNMERRLMPVNKEDGSRFMPPRKTEIVRW